MFRAKVTARVEPFDNVSRLVASTTEHQVLVSLAHAQQCHARAVVPANMGVIRSAFVKRRFSGCAGDKPAAVGVATVGLLRGEMRRGHRFPDVP